MSHRQPVLFEPSPRLPSGMEYRLDFITPDEEAALLAEIALLPHQEAKYRIYTAKRRIVSYGGRYDFSARELLPAGEIPEFLHPLRERIAKWVGTQADRFTHAVVTEYAPGTQLGWHRDVPEFEIVAGVSLASAERMRLRRYPHQKGSKAEVLTLELQPRSAYILRGEARWGWQHSIPPVKAMRYSITFRTRRGT